MLHRIYRKNIGKPLLHFFSKETQVSYAKQHQQKKLGKMLDSKIIKKPYNCKTGLWFPQKGLNTYIPSSFTYFEMFQPL